MSRRRNAHHFRKDMPSHRRESPVHGEFIMGRNCIEEVLNRAPERVQEVFVAEARDEGGCTPQVCHGDPIIAQQVHLPHSGGEGEPVCQAGPAQANMKLGSYVTAIKGVMVAKVCKRLLNILTPKLQRR